jgi:hypothetical protein
MSVMDVTLGREPHREGLFSVTIGVTVDGASRQRTVTQKPHRCGKCDDCDGHDDELQRFSKWGAALYPEMRGGGMGGSMGSTSATKSDAGLKLGVPTSSRTSLPARIVGRMATALQPYPTLRPVRPNSGTMRASLPCLPRDLPRPAAPAIEPPPRGYASLRPQRGRSRRRL